MITESLFLPCSVTVTEWLCQMLVLNKIMLCSTGSHRLCSSGRVSFQLTAVRRVLFLSHYKQNVHVIVQWEMQMLLET